MLARPQDCLFELRPDRRESSISRAPLRPRSAFRVFCPQEVAMLLGEKGLAMVAAAVLGAGTPGIAAAGRTENGRTFESGGVTIWYEEIGGGTGAPLVLVNGGPGFEHGYMHWSNAWDRLATKRKIVFYDQ